MEGRSTVSNITIEEMNYQNPDDRRILKGCLTTWFANPKDLHLTNPSMDYPFDFNLWVRKNYLRKDVTTYVLKKNGWIIGHFSLMHIHDENRVHLFHVFIDRNYRRQGLGKKILAEVEGHAHQTGAQRIILFVIPSNEPANKLYCGAGFDQVGITANGSYRMEKWLTSDKPQRSN